MPDFRLRDDFAPGTPGNVCYLCKSHQRADNTGRREPVVDPNTHIEWEGPIQFCASCVVEMGRLLDMMTPDDVLVAADRITAATFEADQLRAERDDLRTALDALMRAGVAVLTEPDGTAQQVTVAGNVVDSSGRVGVPYVPKSQRKPTQGERLDV